MAKEYPLGSSFRGKITQKKGKKLVLSDDFSQFLTQMMRQHHGKSLSIAVHEFIDAPESIDAYLSRITKPIRD